MSLKDRLGEQRPRTEPGMGAPGTDASKGSGARGPAVDQGEVEVPVALRARLHALAIDRIDLRKLGDQDAKQLRGALRAPVSSLVEADPEAMRGSSEMRQRLIDAILDEVAGLGPIEGLLSDPQVSDILINSSEQVFIERAGKLTLTNIRFNSNAHLLNIIQRIVGRIGRRVDESSPMVDARLADGSRVNAVVMPIAVDGPAMSIRRFGTRRMTSDDLIQRGVGNKDMFTYLTAAVKGKANLLVSGGTGAGKTTLLNILSGEIPHHERVLTIEDSAELSLQGAHVLRMEARPANIEGRGEVSIRACVKNALRMRPDRVIIGEIRGAEVLDMLQAMNTGHEGSMATVHANTPSEAVDRLMMMLALSGATLSSESMAQFIARSVRVVVQVARFADGTRRITGIAEIGDYERDRVQVETVFSFDPIAKKFKYHGKSMMKQRFLDHGLDVRLDAGPL